MMKESTMPQTNHATMRITQHSNNGTVADYIALLQQFPPDAPFVQESWGWVGFPGKPDTERMHVVHEHGTVYYLRCYPRGEHPCPECQVGHPLTLVVSV